VAINLVSRNLRSYKQSETPHKDGPDADHIEHDAAGRLQVQVETLDLKKQRVRWGRFAVSQPDLKMAYPDPEKWYVLPAFEVIIHIFTARRSNW
jgi:hypothetical protein